MAVDLGKQVGPLPLGAWVVVVGSGLGLAYYGYRTQGPKVTEVGTDNISGDTGVGNGAVGGWVTTSPPDDSVTDVAVTTNEQWGVRAINWLIGQGYPAAVSDSAIRKYLAGNDPKPSIQEFTLQGIALSHFGSPPQPLLPSVNEPPVSVPPPVTQKPPPVVKPPPPKSTFRYYTVKPWPAKGSTLSGIAEIYYHKANEWSRIYNANRTGTRRSDGKPGMISNPNLIHPGWVLLIP